MVDLNLQELPKKLEELAKKVPGIGDYLKMENLRDSDKVIRDELADRLDKLRKTLGKAIDARASAKNLKGIDKIDAVTRKIRKVRDRIRFDSRGYTGMFDPEKVGEKELVMLIEFDQKLFTVVERLQDMAEQVRDNAKEGMQDALMDLDDGIDDLEEQLGDREKYSSEVLPQS